MMKQFLLFLFLGMFLNGYAQTRQISGKVTAAEDGSAIPGISILVPGTTAGTYTDADGKYVLKLPAGATTLLVKGVGFVSTQITVTNSLVYDVSLVTDDNQLEEVVVTAGGILVKKRELGAASTTISAQQITQGKSSNFAASLSGKVAGLQVNAVSGGLNPNYRLVLRGQRSITGDNQALLVLDNLIVPTSLLGNLNPEDIEDIQVLNGASAAAAYGSDASNGAIVITTKKGKKGVNEIRFSNTTTFETVSYNPKLQNKYGAGTTPDAVKSYTSYENQQYGPKFDGSIREIGKPLSNGSIQSIPYSPVSDKLDFWETGIQNQTDFALQSGDEKGSYYLSAQYFTQKSTVPKDEYNRISVRANGVRNFYKNFKATYGANFISNKYDQTSIGANLWNSILQTPANIPLTQYKDWQNDPFANPNGYYNEYYGNPYFLIDNNRTNTNNSYFQGNVDFAYNPIKPVTLTYRLGLSNTAQDYKSTTGKFGFTDYTKSISGSSKTDVAGAVSDGSSKSVQLVSELIAEYKTKLSPDLDFYILGAGYLRDNLTKSVSGSSNGGLVIDGLYNLSNSRNQASVSESNSRRRQVSLRGEARLGFKDYLFLHITARNDWSSVLEQQNRSFFYPSADLSFVATDAIPALKTSLGLKTLKLRGGYSYVGNVNLGAYAINATYGVAGGFPYSGGPGFTLGNRMVAANLQPEITKGYEAGFDFELSKVNVDGGLTFYKTNTYNQTLSVQVSTATGYSSYLTNVGEVENKGIETYLNYSPIKNRAGLTVTVGANYAYTVNKVISLSDQADVLNLGTATGSRVVAAVGQPFPLLQVNQYNRDDQGRVIVDAVTGFPSYDGAVFTTKGVTNPPNILGANLEVQYKRFRLYTLFEYRGGHYIMNSVSTGYDFAGSGIRTTWFNRERFVFPNSSYWNEELGQYVENTSIQTRSGGADFWTNGVRNTGIGENYTHSAAFWKWREASLSYDIPSQKLTKGAVKRATISVQGRNLFIWAPKTNLYTDPEYSALGSDSNAVGFTSMASTPPARYVGGTLSLTF